MFVTWKANGRLRGCIGTLTAVELENLSYFAIQSALKDRRFEPITKQELNTLSCTVSLLVQYEDCATWKDWDMDIHGIVIEFKVDGKVYSGTYLPEVALEQGWDHRTTVESLMAKAGYRGQVTEELLSSIKVTRYQSSKATVHYDDLDDN